MESIDRVRRMFQHFGGKVCIRNLHYTKQELSRGVRFGVSSLLPLTSLSDQIDNDLHRAFRVVGLDWCLPRMQVSRQPKKTKDFVTDIRALELCIALEQVPKVERRA
jgi:hypothetical protein